MRGERRKEESHLGQRKRERGRGREKKGLSSSEAGQKPTDVGLKLKNRESITRAEVRCLTTEPPRWPRLVGSY